MSFARCEQHLSHKNRPIETVVLCAEKESVRERVEQQHALMLVVVVVVVVVVFVGRKIFPSRFLVMVSESFSTHSAHAHSVDRECFNASDVHRSVALRHSRHSEQGALATCNCHPAAAAAAVTVARKRSVLTQQSEAPFFQSRRCFGRVRRTKVNEEVLWLSMGCFSSTNRE